MRFLSLFDGVYGFGLGLERAGMQCAGRAEIDPFCNALMDERRPSVLNYGDVRNVVTKEAVETVDLVCGGPPCQPVSQAAARTERGDGWLWPEMRRAVEVVAPRWVIFENPESVRYKNRGLGIVLRDLAALRYDCFWDVLPASLFGAPHRRARIWVVANSNRDGKSKLSLYAKAHQLQKPQIADRSWPNPPANIRVDDGVSGELDRLRVKALGNAAMPLIAEWLGNRIMQVEQQETP